MDAKLFDKVVSWLSSSRSRRTTLGGLVLGVAMGLGTPEISEAGKNAKRRRRRLKRQAKRRRLRCLRACDESCGLCFHATSGDIVCGTQASAQCSPADFCQSDGECGGGSNHCIAASQFRGESEITRLFSELCDYPVGVCVGINPVC